MKVDLRTYRLNKGLSAQKLADEIGVSIDVIYHLERRGNRPQPANALAVASHFGLTVEQMWPREFRTETEVAA